MGPRSACFLNGVCRHEHGAYTVLQRYTFLNGVCRHELFNIQTEITGNFLNGVCRHEHAGL